MKQQDYIFMEDIKKLIGQLILDKYMLQKQIERLTVKNKELEEAYLKLSKQDQVSD